MRKRRSAAGYGSPRSTYALITAKIVTASAVPTPRENTAIAVKPRALISPLIAVRRSEIRAGMSPPHAVDVLGQQRLRRRRGPSAAQVDVSLRPSRHQ